MVPKSLGGWTFVRNVGTSRQQLVVQTAIPFERLQVRTPEDLVSAFDRFVDRVISATHGSRSIPFGAGGTVLEQVSFVNGAVQVIPHRLGTASVRGIFGIPSTGAAPAATMTADAQNVTITPSATWTGDVYLLVTP
jgi:hypothetical protein